MNNSKKLLVLVLAFFLIGSVTSCNYKTCPTYSKHMAKPADKADRKA